MTRRWLTVTGPLAWCYEPGCDFVYCGDGDRTAREAIARAQAHADATGHTPLIERGQSMGLVSRPEVDRDDR